MGRGMWLRGERSGLLRRHPDDKSQVPNFGPAAHPDQALTSPPTKWGYNRSHMVWWLSSRARDNRGLSKVPNTPLPGRSCFCTTELDRVQSSTARLIFDSSAPPDWLQGLQLITGRHEGRAATQAGTRCSASRGHTDLQSWDRSPSHPGQQAGLASLQVMPTPSQAISSLLCALSLLPMTSPSVIMGA